MQYTDRLTVNPFWRIHIPHLRSIYDWEIQRWFAMRTTKKDKSDKTSGYPSKRSNCDSQCSRFIIDSPKKGPMEERADIRNSWLGVFTEWIWDRRDYNNYFSIFSEACLSMSTFKTAGRRYFIHISFPIFFPLDSPRAHQRGIPLFFSSFSNIYCSRMRKCHEKGLFVSVKTFHVAYQTQCSMWMLWWRRILSSISFAWSFTLFC